MNHFPVLTKLLNEELARLAKESNDITNEINKHSDLKALMNNYTVVRADSLAALSNRLVEIQLAGAELSRVHSAVTHGGLVIRAVDSNQIQFFLTELFDRLPKHIQEEWEGNFNEMSKRLASGRGLL